ncbi:MAG: hypothetical protein ACK5Z2_18570 [Bacteroidota bacterium]|jgi:hypothetical protein
MPHYITTLERLNDKYTHQYSGIGYDELSSRVHSQFQSAGYKVLQVYQGGAQYEKGNYTMRILFGAFVKYFKFAVQVTDGGNGLLNVSVVRQTSGMSGGLIGVNQVKKEMQRLEEVLRQI